MDEILICEMSYEDWCKKYPQLIKEVEGYIKSFGKQNDFIVDVNNGFITTSEYGRSLSSGISGECRLGNSNKEFRFYQFGNSWTVKCLGFVQKNAFYVVEGHFGEYEYYNEQPYCLCRNEEDAKKVIDKLKQIKLEILKVPKRLSNEENIKLITDALKLNDLEIEWLKETFYTDDQVWDFSCYPLDVVDY